MTAPARFLAVFCCLIGVSIDAHSQDASTEQFEAVEYALERANSLNASLLSPRNYALGLKEYKSAKATVASSGYSERVGRKLIEAEANLRQAALNAEQANKSFAATIEARAAAETAEAERLAPTDWTKAEAQLERAARDLEDQKTESALQYGAISEDGYRTAELSAIKARYLTGARRQIAEAEQMKVGKFAPRSLSRARKLLNQADASLKRDRYLTEEPAALADEAVETAKRAIYIAAIGQRIQEKTLTMEEVILDLEQPIVEVADTLDIETDLTAGYSETTEQILDRLNVLLGLPAELGERDALILGLEEELHELDMRLRDASQERQGLVREIEDQARTMEKFERVGQVFSDNEALVLQEGESIVLRMVGLNFAVNSSKLQSDTIELVRKSKQAIDMFPQSTITIEGHTDSSGKEKRNLELSAQRAQAVMDYMRDELKIPEYRMNAIGYGDTRPIASNKTSEGKARNRRIDLIIVPKR